MMENDVKNTFSVHFHIPSLILIARNNLLLCKVIIFLSSLRFDCAFTNHFGTEASLIESSYFGLRNVCGVVYPVFDPQLISAIEESVSVGNRLCFYHITRVWNFVDLKSSGSFSKSTNKIASQIACAENFTKQNNSWSCI